MAEARRLAGLDLGLGPGSHLSYIPSGENERDNDSGQPLGSLHTSRITSGYPHFNLVGSPAELYPPSKTGLASQTHSRLSAERNLQRRWLLKSHPEAFMADEVLSELLTEDLRKFPKSDEPPMTKPLLALGEMVDWSMPSRPILTGLLAVATGASGELLRLSHVEDSRWTWDEGKESVLHLSVIDSLDNFEEVIWGSDGLPISQVKFVTSTSPSASHRWLIVQKQTSTVILQPGYDKVPRSRGHATGSGGGAAGERDMSRIMPNPIFTLGHRETGGSAHVDVALNQPADGRPPQLCVMDECGYWTLWNIMGKAGHGKNSLRLSLYQCGHIFEGPLLEMPRASVYPVGPHGALFVGASQSESGLADAFPGFESQEGSLKRSRYLLTWNSERMEVLDLETGISLPKLDLVTAASRQGHILDVQPSPVSQNHVFVLTTKCIVWVDVFHLSRGSQSVYQPIALLTCPHVADATSGLKVSIGHASDDDAATSMVCVYSTKGAHVSMFWFRLEEHSLPEWHRQTASLLPGRVPNSGLESITFQPARLSSKRGARGIGAKYQQDGGQFYQGMILGHDLGVRYCMCFSSPNPSVRASLPTTRIKWTQPDQHRKWRKKRQRLLRHMGDHFVIPDSMAYLDEQLARQPPGAQEANLAVITENGKMPRPIGFNFGYIAGVVRDAFLADKELDSFGIDAALVDTIQGLIQHGHLVGALPLRTWLEVSGDSTDDRKVPSQTKDEDSGEALQALFGEVDEQTVLVQLGVDLPADPSTSLTETRERYNEIWLEPLRDRMPEEYLSTRERWIAELARDVTLETYGVAVQESPLFTSLIPPSAQLSQSIPSSMPFPSSQISSSSAWGPNAPSSSQTQPSGPSPNDAFARLQLLAPTVKAGKIGKAKPAQLLSFWPSERGVDTEGYLSSVAIATEKQFDYARQRLHKIESKRRAFKDKYKLPSSSMRQALSSQVEPEHDSLRVPMRPVAMTQYMSSQQAPASSQSQGLPPLMSSQPLSGPFGERKKAKKPKKKSGFR